jgi:hypothetical protein
MNQETSFPEGFVPFTETAKEQYAMGQQIPACRFAKSGFLSFNKAASALLLGDNYAHKSVWIAYNSRTKSLALRPTTIVNRGKTYSLGRTGMRGDVVVVYFKTLAAMWDIPMDGKLCGVTRDEQSGVIFVGLRTINSAPKHSAK